MSSKGMATCPPKHVPKHAGLAQLGERQTEDLKVMCSIHITRNFWNLRVIHIFCNRLSCSIFLCRLYLYYVV
jgi:hypothetical protein